MSPVLESRRRESLTLLVPGTDGSNARVPPAPAPTPVDDAQLDAIVARVDEVRSRIVDEWEATALLESLGYTDARVQREYGVADTRVVGQLVARRMAQREPQRNRWAPPAQPPMAAIVVRSAASTLIYAIPWLAVFMAQVVWPNVLRLPARVAPALAVAFMFSLVASGGFVQALVRRGEFYVGLQQGAMARAVVYTLLRVGVAATIGFAFAGMFAAWYFELFSASAIVLAADAFVIMSVLWMVCGMFAIRQQHWRIAIAFGIGFVAFALARRVGADVITAQVSAVAVVLGLGAVQVRRVLGAMKGASTLPRGVQMPRLSVVAYWTLPYFWYGTVYFAFLFADRLVAATAGELVTGAFGIPVDYNLGMELALLTLLVAASGVEVAGALFGRALASEAVRPVGARVSALASALAGHHARAMLLACVGFLLTAVLIGFAGQRLLPGGMSLQASLTLVAGDAGYACLALGLVNSLVLFQIRRPWLVVRVFTAGLGINLVGGFVLSRLLGGFHAVDGLVLGAAYFAVASTVAVRRSLQHPDYAYAVSA